MIRAWCRLRPLAWTLRAPAQGAGGVRVAGHEPCPAVLALVRVQVRHLRRACAGANHGRGGSAPVGSAGRWGAPFAGLLLLAVHTRLGVMPAKTILATEAGHMTLSCRPAVSGGAHSSGEGVVTPVQLLIKCQAEYDSVK